MLIMAIIGFRWHRFPWDRYAATSFAWGIGPSYATEIPPIEIETSGSSSRWLIYRYGEKHLRSYHSKSFLT